MHKEGSPVHATGAKERSTDVSLTSATSTPRDTRRSFHRSSYPTFEVGETRGKNKNLRGSRNPGACHRHPGAVNQSPSHPVTNQTSKAQDAAGCGFQQSPGVASRLPLRSQVSCTPALTGASARSLCPGQRARGQSCLAWPAGTAHSGRDRAHPGQSGDALLLLKMRLSTMNVKHER